MRHTRPSILSRPEIVSILGGYIMGLRGPKPTSPLSRVLKHVVALPDGGCWMWNGRLTSKGYGATLVIREGAGRDRYPSIHNHRITYEAFVGPIPAGLVLDHLCRTPRCCNPRHLEAVPQGENLRRGAGAAALRARYAAQTHCLRGHAFDEANTYHYRWKQWTKRACRTCRRAWAARKTSNRRGSSPPAIPPFQ